MELHYPFFWDGQNYLSQTLFFAGILPDPAARPLEVSDAGYHQGLLWIDIKEIETVFAYDANILKAVKAARAHLLLPDLHFQ